MWEGSSLKSEANKLFNALKRTQQAVECSRERWFSRLAHLFERSTVEEEMWEEVEGILIAADVGVDTTSKLIQKVRERVKKERVDSGEQLRSAFKIEMLNILNVASAESGGLTQVAAPPREIILVVGVNGSGKTTSIAKLAHRLACEGKRVMLAAADTFRAAAIEQLKLWGEQAGAEVIAHQPGADPGAVVFDALQAAKNRGADVVIVDTAGRLHTKFNLMEELKKVKRVITRFDTSAPQEVLLVLDATTGQNGLAQAKYFTQAVGVTGIILAKLDSTAKGGIVFVICDELNIPIRFIGTGEKIDDLAPFDASTFIEALFAEEKG